MISMIRQPNCHALTGYQRVMPAQMQGDGTFEICADPMGFFLRQLQSYDFEVRSNCESKSRGADLQTVSSTSSGATWSLLGRR